MLKNLKKKIFYFLFTKIKNKKIENLLLKVYISLFKNDKEIIFYLNPLTIIKILNLKVILQFPKNATEPFNIKTEDFTLQYDGKNLYKKENEIETYIDLNNFKEVVQIEILIESSKSKS